MRARPGEGLGGAPLPLCSPWSSEAASFAKEDTPLRANVSDGSHLSAADHPIVYLLQPSHLLSEIVLRLHVPSSGLRHLPPTLL